jgi:hypothetical protein
MLKVILSFWNTVMSDRHNPLSGLPPVVRYQTMMVLALMWSFIFCAMVGWMFLFPYWAIGHVVLLSLGFFVTTYTFGNARKRGMAMGHRDGLKTTDGRGVRHDDVWGG